MSFNSIHMLWLVWALPLLLLVCLWGFRKRRALLTDYASKKALAAILPHISTARRWGKLLLLFAAMLLMVVSLAGPQYGYTWKELERRGVDLVIALDCSRSMLAKDIQPGRLERAKREILDLLGKLEGDRVGLVAFAGTSFLQCPLTLDYEGFNLFLGALSPDYLPVGGTDVAGAIETAISAFKKEDATDKAIILITDGEATGDDPAAAARNAAAAGIKIFCIGMGAQEGVPIPSTDGGYIKDRSGNIVVTKLDETALKKLTSVTGGVYVRSVSGDMDLDAIYQGIRGTMETASLGQQQTKVFENRYQWFLSLAILLVLVEFVTPVRKKAVLMVFLTLIALPRFASAGDLKSAVEDGAAAYASGEYDKSVQHYVAAQLEAPEKKEIVYDLGNARYKAEDYDNALQSYAQAMETSDPGLKAKVLYNMGNAYFRKGDLEKAIEQYEAALALDQNDTQAKENLAYVKQLKENPPQDSSKGEQNQKDQKKEENKDSDKQDSGDSKDQKETQSQEDNKSGESQEKTPDHSEDAKDESQKESGAEQEQKDQQNKQDAQGNEAQQEQPDAGTKENSAAKLDEDALRQAEKMLNRLQDQPGRAMMPAYGAREVEKDW